jgi:ubiquinone/menaquinone biosynthesis C-methylase UbiE/DNA-binding MarR family transcriptional regulator
MITAASPTIFDQLSALSDPTRARLLLVLERHELTVGELCAALQLPQSTVSRHLRILSDEGWLTSRAEGTSRRYRMVAGSGGPAANRLWQVVRSQLASSTLASQDARRLATVLETRRSRARAFFDSAADGWDRMRRDVFGARSDLLALLSLMEERWVVGDLGCGTGQLAATLAPVVGRVIAVDESGPMLAAARKRLAGFDNVDVRHGRVEALPIEDEELDVALLFLVTQYLAEPLAALGEISRALRPGGRLLIVDLMPHDREDYAQQLGHLWQGFSAEQMESWTSEAGLGDLRYRELPADSQAKGPDLFVASVKKEESSDARP